MTIRNQTGWTFLQEFLLSLIKQIFCDLGSDCYILAALSSALAGQRCTNSELLPGLVCVFQQESSIFLCQLMIKTHHIGRKSLEKLIFSIHRRQQTRSWCPYGAEQSVEAPVGFMNAQSNHLSGLFRFH